MGRDTTEDAPNQGPLFELGQLLSRYRADAWTVVLYAICVGLFALATPVAVQALVNTAAFGTVLQPIVVLVLLLLLCLVCASALKLLKTWAVEVLQRRLFIDTVSRLAYRLPRADVDALSGLGGAQLIHRFFDLFTVQKAAASLLLGGVDVVLAASVGMLVLAFYHPFLLAFDLALVCCLTFVLLVLGRGGVRTSVTESSYKYALAGFLTELGSTKYVYRDGGGIAHSQARLDQLARGYLVSRAAHFRVVIRQFSGALVTQAIASAGLLGLGGWLVIERELTLGQLVAAELIVTIVVSTLTDLGKHVETYYDLVTGVHKLEALTSVPIEDQEQQEDSESEPLAAGPCELAIGDLWAAPAGRPLFSEAHLQVPRGARVALMGPAECGKTYLLDILFGIRRPSRGRIVLDGVDIRELSKLALRERVAVVRGPEIISGTIVENVRLSRRNISPGKVRALLDRLGLAEELARLPEGVETVVGPGGTVLSDSQAWRLTVARAIARSPGLIALDADLSAIDHANLERVLGVLSHPDAPWTLVVVSEHPQALRHCQGVVRISDGRFVQESLK